MSKFQTLSKLANCSDKAGDLKASSEATIEALSESAVAQYSALERLFYLIMTLENLENKVRRGIMAARDPVKVDLEANVKKCISIVNNRIQSNLYDYKPCSFIIKNCFEVLSQINESFKLCSQLSTMLISAAEHLYKLDKNSYVEKIFELFTSISNNSSGNFLSKVLKTHPDLIPEIMKRCYTTFQNKEGNFHTFSALIAEISEFNGKSVSSALMDILNEDININPKLRFVINILRSVPALQSVSITLLYESKSFETLMSSPISSIAPSLIDDLAKLFIFSHVNSYNTMMSLLEKRRGNTLGPLLLEKILLNMELAIFSANEHGDKTLHFLEDMSGEGDIMLFCKGLQVMNKSTHPYILKVLSLISLYKGKITSMKIVSELFVTLPYENFQSYLETVTGVYPCILTACFKKILKNLQSNNLDSSNVFIFFENAEKTKVTGNCELSSEDVITIAKLLKSAQDYRLILTLLSFLDAKPRDLNDIIFICNIIVEKYLKITLTITSDNANLEVLEVLEELKISLAQWGVIHSSIRITILRHLLSLATSDDMFYEDDIEEEILAADKPLLTQIRSGVIESSDKVHSGQIQKKHKSKHKYFTDNLAIQQVMHLIQSLHYSSPKAVNEIAVFILDYLCSDCNILALWPDEESMKYTLDRDLVLFNKFTRHPILWNILEEALISKQSDLVVIIRAMLTVFISFWSNSRVDKCKYQLETCQQTVRVLDLLSKEHWLPLPLHNISQLIPIIAPYEARLLLMEIWHHLKLHQPHVSGFPTNRCQSSLKKTVLTIIQNNIEHVGVSAFLFSRWNLIDVV